MASIGIGNIADGFQTTFRSLTGTSKSVKVNGQEVTPESDSGQFVTFAEPPPRGALIEITVDDNREAAPT